MTEPIDWQFSLVTPAGSLYFNTAGEPDDLGCLWAMPTPDGWDSATGRTNSSPLPSADGATILDGFKGARNIHGQNGQITGPGAAAIELAKRRLVSICESILRADGTFLHRTDAGDTLYATVRYGGPPAFPGTRFGPESVAFDFLVTAGDPRKYDVDVVTAVVASSTVQGGARYPVSYPLQYASDADVTTPTATSLNAGNADAPFVAAFAGDLNNPVLIDRLGGLRIPLNISLPAGQSITVDTLNETVQLGDGTDMYTAFDDLNGTPLSQLRIPRNGQCDWVLLGQGEGSCTVTSHNTYA